jgi:hypothetical protein
MKFKNEIDRRKAKEFMGVYESAKKIKDDLVLDLKSDMV